MRTLLMAVLWLSAASAAAAYFAHDYLTGSEPRRVDPETLAQLQGAFRPESGIQELDEPRPLPELAFVDAQGRAVRLSDFRGRTVLLNVWATWCGPCREEMPALDRLQARLGGERFEVVALSTDVEGREVVERFYHELGIERLGMYTEPSEREMQALGLIGLPTTLLIDPQGREIARKLGAAEWDSPEMIAFIRKHLPERVAESARTERAHATAGRHDVPADR